MGIRDPSGDLVSGCDEHGISVRCKLPESGSASGEDIYVQILADHLMVEDWKNMLQDPDQLEVFYQEFSERSQTAE